jgi:hypothetical protein
VTFFPIGWSVFFVEPLMPIWPDFMGEKWPRNLTMLDLKHFELMGKNGSHKKHTIYQKVTSYLQYVNMH